MSRTARSRVDRPMKLVVGLLLWAGACGQDARPRPPTAPAADDAAAAPTAPAVPPASTSAPGPIAMSASAARGRLTLTFANTGATPLTVATHTAGARLPNFDGLTVELDGPGGPRTLTFVQDRDRSAVMTAELAPGASRIETIDLVEWSILGPTGASLAPGTYQLTARWDGARAGAGAAFLATATTTLAITAPVAGSCTNDGLPSPSAAKLELLAHQVPTGRATVEVGLYNAGDTRVCVHTHIKTHELQNDWLTILYADGDKYHHVSRVIRLDDDRDKSYPLSALLEPGQVAWQTYDVDAWARRARNGSEPLPAGSLYGQAAYDSTREREVWAGTLTAEAFELRVE